MNKAKRSFWLVCTLFFLGLLVTAESLAVERILRRNEAIAEEKAYQEYRNTGCKNGRPDPLIQGEIKGALSRNRCRVGQENVGQRVSGAGSDASEYRYAAQSLCRMQH